jgi:hypothetical protein
MLMRAVAVVMVHHFADRGRLGVHMMSAAANVHVHEHREQADDGNDNAPHLQNDGIYTDIHSHARIIARCCLAVN